MKWNNSKSGGSPEHSGAYTVSVKRPTVGGEYVFSYLGWYDAKHGRWHKYDPFSDSKDQSGEDITQMVVGWASETVTYLG
jgi:hypothetical protein